MTKRRFASLPESAAINPSRGGVVRSGGNIYAPLAVAVSPTDVGLGPVAVGVPDGGGVTVSELTYVTQQESGGGLPLIGVTIAGMPAPGEDEKDPPVTRRLLLGLVAGLLATGSAKAASDDTVTIGLAEFTIDDATAPVSVRVADIVDKVLPTSTEILVDATGTRVGKVVKPAEGVTLPADTRGTVTVYLKDSRGVLGRLLAWARSVVGDSVQGITFERRLSKSAALFETGSLVKLSSHPAIVDPVASGDPDETRLRIGSTTIPHQDSDKQSDVGGYGVFESSLVYEVGESPPDSDKWTLTTNLDLLTQAKSDIPL